MSHEAFEEAVPLYAVGALDRQERQSLEAHLLTGCVSCHAALKEYRAVAGLLPHGLPPITVPPELKARVMHGAREFSPSDAEKRERSGNRMGLAVSADAWSLRPAFALALILLLVGTGAYALFLRSQIASEQDHQQHIEIALKDNAARMASLQRQIAEQERQLAGLQAEFANRTGALGELQAVLSERESQVAELRNQLAQREQETAGLRKTLAQRDEMLTFLRSPNVKVISLAGLERAKESGALLLFDPDSKKAFFYAFNMPPLPPGKTYQLWAILDKPVSAGTFTTDVGQKGRMVIKTLPAFTATTRFAVSLEPEGGRPQPTGDIYLASQL